MGEQSNEGDQNAFPTLECLRESCWSFLAGVGGERERPAELNLNVKDQDKFRSEIFYELIQNSKENEEAGAKYIFVTRYFC